MSNRFAVIGSKSFSGHAFCSYLKASGIECMEFARPDYDLNRNMDGIIAEIRAGRPTHVVIFAALNMVAESWLHFADYYQTNIIAIARLHNALQGMDFIDKVVQISTPEVYGATQTFLREDAPFRPSTPYAVSRAAIDMHLLAMHKATGYPVCFTRSVNVYGSGQQPYRIIPKTVLKILRGEKITLDGGGVSTRSFMHVEDMASSAYMVALAGRPGEAYHTSTPVQTSIRALVESICQTMRAEFRDVVTVGPERPGKDLAYQLNSDKIRSELGWTDRISLHAGLLETIEWFKWRRDDYAGNSLEYGHRA